jgi:hypothetical protein
MHQLSIKMKTKSETYLQKTLKATIKRIKRSCKRMYVRYVLFSRKMNERGQQVSDTQKYIMSIARMAINHPDTDFEVEYESGKRYLKNDTIGLYIIFYKARIEITNHVYHYDVIVTDRNWARISKLYNDVTKKRILGYEEAIMSNVKNSLSLIYEKMIGATYKK